MQTVISRRRCALLLSSVGLSLATGCTSIFTRKPAAEADRSETPRQQTPGPIHVIYRTRTDRLNLAGAALPHVSIAELRISFPHYQEKVGVCLAVVKTTPCSQTATPFPERGLSSTVTSLFDGTASDGSAPPSQAWSCDVPLWEVQAIVASLEKLNFFRKHRTVLSADVFLSVETEKHAVGKKYRPVAELDAMVLRIAQTSATESYAHPTAPNMAPATATPSVAARPELMRLPAFN